MTRFGEISPLLQNFINLCQMVEDLFIAGKNFKPSLAKLLRFCVAFQCWKGPHIEKQYSHLVTLDCELVLGTNLF